MKPTFTNQGLLSKLYRIKREKARTFKKKLIFMQTVQSFMSYPADIQQDKYEGKIARGQFFTRGRSWLKGQVLSFIKKSGCRIAYDPFAGAGDLIHCSDEYGIADIAGLDIDPSLKWRLNDSLVSIPHIDNSIIITNPPYLSSYSASRKKLMPAVRKYFENTCYDDIYLVALDRILAAQEYSVAIIPETFLNSGYRQMRRLDSITILEENPFNDTDVPVCVACFDGRTKPLSEISVYKNNDFFSDLGHVFGMRPVPCGDVPVRFNVLSGWLALRGVDTTNPAEKIRFGFKEDFSYNWQKGIKHTSRLLTLIQIDVRHEDRKRFILECNVILEDLRKKSGDIILSPFKGNMKDGTRRRRLDYKAARAIMEQAWHKIYGGNRNEGQPLLFQ